MRSQSRPRFAILKRHPGEWRKCNWSPASGSGYALPQADRKTVVEGISDRAQAESAPYCACMNRVGAPIESITRSTRACVSVQSLPAKNAQGLRVSGCSYA